MTLECALKKTPNISMTVNIFLCIWPIPLGLYVNKVKAALLYLEQGVISWPHMVRPRGFPGSYLIGTRVHNQGFIHRLLGSINPLALYANLCAYMHFPGAKRSYFYGVFGRALEPKMCRTIYLYSSDQLGKLKIPPGEVTL